MYPFEKTTLIWLSTALLLLLLFMPLLVYLARGWKARRNQILSLFTEDTIKYYYSAYFPADKSDGKVAREDFAKDFDRKYGVVNYAPPALMLFLVSLYLLYMCMNIVFREPGIISNTTAFTNPWTAVAGVAGAYMWVLYDFILRERSLDFSTSHVNHASYRMVLSVPIAYAVGVFFEKTSSVAFPMAVFAGAFPMGSLFAFMRQIAQQKLGGAIEKPEDQKLRLEQLPSIDTKIDDRFAQEGITTIPQLANFDPVSLTIRSGFRFRFVLDCLSEALAWCKLTEEQFKKAREYSLCGVLEIAELVEDIDYRADSSRSDNQKRLREKKRAQATLDLMAKSLHISSEVFERNLRMVQEDERTTFIQQMLWLTGGRRYQPRDETASSAGLDEAGAVLYDFVFPNGVEDGLNRKIMDTWLADNNIKASLFFFIRSERYPLDRRLAGRYLRQKGYVS